MAEMTSKGTREGSLKPRAPDPVPGRPPGQDPGSEPQYDSALKPLMWLAIPFVLVMLYALLTN